MVLSIVSIISLGLGVTDAYASHNPNLYVSAENPSFNNHFSGSMVIEVVVNDSDLKDIDDAIGEPDVTLNGKDLRMVQGTDGSWYAYFSHIDAAKRADQIVVDAGAGAIGESLDFGVFCSANTPSSVLGVSFSDTDGIALPQDGGATLTGESNGNAGFSSCGGTITASATINNVIRNEQSINTNSNVPSGQIGLDANAWPIIQLFSFDDVEIKYNKPGNPQQVNLEYDEIPNITMSLDRTNYPAGSEVFVTINDMQLNQDPTDEDSWTFNVNSTKRSFYQAYTESGADSGNGGAGLINLVPHLSSLDFEDNGIVTMGLGSILELKTNNDQPDSFVSDGTNTFSQIITIVETSPNSGIFRNYDNGKVSTIGVLSNAPRGQTGTITYNDESKSILTGSFSASVELGTKGTSFEPGTTATVTITDSDQNVNSGKKDTLNVFTTSDVIPTLKIGSPLTLKSASDVKFYTLSSTPIFPPGGTSITSSTPDKISDRLVIDTTTAANAGFTKVSINSGFTAQSLQSLFIDTSIGANIGTNWLNYDLRSFQNQLDISDFTDTNMTLYFGALSDPTPVTIIDSGDLTSAKGFVQIDDADVTAIKSKSGTAFIVINFDATDDSSPEGSITNEVNSQPIAIDFFSLGERSGTDVNNAIYRFELEETSNNSGIFTGTIEYGLFNQVNIEDPDFISSARTIDKKIKFIAANKLTDEEGIAISYSDLDKVGVSTTTSTKTDIKTSSGTVKTNSPSYRFGQPVTIILNDPDLNQKHDTIETYRVINDPNSPNVDTVGTASGELLLEVKIKDIRYKRCTVSGVQHGGLAATGFTLIETGPSTGIFEGSFKMPSQICNKDGTKLISSAGGSLDARYHDFRDSSGNPNIFGLSGSTSSSPKPLTLNSDNFMLPKYKDTEEVIISGTLTKHSRGVPLSVLLYGPNQLTQNFAVMPTDSGSYRAIIILNHDSPTGVYSIELEYNGDLVGTGTFTVSKSLIPSWIKNNAKWWSDDIVSDSEFFNGMEHLINEKIIDIPDTEKSLSPEKTLPDWIKNNAKWWGNDLISDDEFITALEFLVKKGIIRV